MEDGWTIYIRDGEDSFPFLTVLGERVYWPDLLAWKDDVGWVCFEVDGRKGHSTPKDLQKMRLRDETFQKFDVRTVRIATSVLVGKRKQNDASVLREIDFQLV